MSLVFQFNLVCSDQWKQPLTSLAYFLGGLWGCLVSGQISDRYFSVSVQTFPVATPVSCYGGRMFFLSMSGSYLSANKALAKEMMICYTSWKKEVQIAEWYVIFILKCRYLHHISTLSKHEAFMVSLLIWMEAHMLLLWLTPLCCICTSGLAGSLCCSVPSPCLASSAAPWPSLRPGPSSPYSSSLWAWVRSLAT